ncbi:MAG: glycine cleavage T C-terminal barrel domain-containing protein [Verrucomicrobiota bacterium]
MKDHLHAEDGVLFDLSSRAKFRMTGSDRLRFLNGQITNEARKATETDAFEACVLNAKGKTNAHLFFSSTSDSFLLDADPALREILPARLERYLIADDVEITDITDQFAIFHLLGPSAPSVPNEWRIVHVRRFTMAGWDIWVNSRDRERAREELSAQFQLSSEEEAEIFRIESGIPRWGRELTEEIIPIEANLEERCVDYEKGCYIGQEVISRIKMSGQTNKRLHGLLVQEGSPIPLGARLRTPDGREAGWVTSAGWSARLNRQIALGFVKRGFNSPGSVLHVTPPDDAPATELTSTKVVALPFI